MPNSNKPVSFETGTLTEEQIEAVFETLPVDITFIDKDETVRYFSKFEKRAFKRPKAIIGREVQRCHPKESLEVVNKLVDELKTGKRDSAHFWIDLKGRFIYIRYLPVKSRQTGEYLGCLEVTQDITEIKGLEGEKRLLD